MKIADHSSSSDIKNLQQSKTKSYKKCIRQIYLKQFDLTRFYLMSRDLVLEISSGQQYGIIRDQLQQICKTHRRFIADSAKIICSSKDKYSCLGFEQITKGNQEDEQFKLLKQKQCVIWVLYQHYRSIAESNRQVCVFWEIVRNYRQKQNENKSQRPLQLKQSVLNHLTIKELLPPSQNINLRPINQNLKQLIDTPLILKKNHLKEMYALFIESEMTLNTKKKASIKEQNQKVGIRKTTLTMKYQGSSQNWLQRCKQDSVGSKLSQILGGKFSFLQNENSQISQKAYEQIKRQIIPSTLLDLGLSENNIEITYKSVETKTIYGNKTSSEQLDRNQKLILQLNQQDKKVQLKELARIEKAKQTQRQQTLEKSEKIQEQLTKKKKKKKKNKKKKNQEDKKEQKQDKVTNIKIQQQKVEEEFILEQGYTKDLLAKDTIKMITNAVIDHSQRIKASLVRSTLSQWSKWAQHNLDQI